MSKTGISWCDEVWNPVVGCAAGCEYCYASELHNRRREAWLAGWEAAPKQYHEPFNTIQLFPERLQVPLRRKKPTVFFVNSVSDLFDPGVPTLFLADVFQTMERARKLGHTFLVLTKQAERMADLFEEVGEPIPDHVWFGVTVENQETANERIPHLLRVPGKRFLSIEPMLGAIDIDAAMRLSGSTCDYCGGHVDAGHDCYLAGFGIDQVILGGESGKDARPMHPQWARDVRDLCENAADTPFFFKQWGEWRPTVGEWEPKPFGVFPNGEYHQAGLLMGPINAEAIKIAKDHPGETYEKMHRIGKAKAGRLLDGYLHDGLAWGDPQ